MTINVNKKFKVFFIIGLLISACAPSPDSYSNMPDLFEDYEKKAGFVIVNIPGGSRQGPVGFKKDSLNKLSKRIYQYRLLLFFENEQTITADSLLHTFEETLLKYEMEAFKQPTDSLNSVLFLPKEPGEWINDAFLFLSLKSDPPSIAIVHMIGEMPQKDLSAGIDKFDILLP